VRAASADKTASRADPRSNVCGVTRIFAALSLAAMLLALGTMACAQPPVTVAPGHGLIVTSQRIASAVGAAILGAGGNAVDAAVAIGYALAVVEPCCGNLGGGGFMTIHFADGRDTFINFRETAPAAATATMYLDPAGKPDPERSRRGYLAVGVPGTVMGLDRAAREYGSLPRVALLAPAIALARDGFVLTRDDTAMIDEKAAELAKDPAAAEIFLKPGGRRYQPGDRFVQRDLAATLQTIADNGPPAFYEGAIAAAVVAASSSHGGMLTRRDFVDYTATEGPPLYCSYRGYVVISAPPPSSGGTTICEILNILEGYDLNPLGFHSARAIAVMAAAMARGYADRNAFLGDPDFVHNPLDRLLSKGYAAGIRAAIDAGGGGPAAPPGPRERAETTHYSVVDSAGSAVAVTYTINGYFGAGVVAPGTGFLLNNEMDDFAAKPGTANLYGVVQGVADAIMPGKRPLSSMAPTIVERDGRVVLVLGSPGGSRIITTVLDPLVNLIDYGMSAADAVAASRVHYQGEPDRIFYERGSLPAETIAALTDAGYTLAAQKPWGAVELIAAADGRLCGVSDARRPGGAAVGY
jgi:gamma-glutamyltranspeptidase / glutathione hydrolase